MNAPNRLKAELQTPHFAMEPAGRLRYVAAQSANDMNKLKDVIQLRVRYSETDQMGIFYNSRALEWFECGRTELMRNRLGMSYTMLEEKGVFLPLVEAHLEFQGGADMTTCCASLPSWNCTGGRSCVSTLRLRTAGPANRWCAATLFTRSLTDKAKLSGRRNGFWKC